MTATPPAVYADEADDREVVRRARVLNGMNLAAIEELRGRDLDGPARAPPADARSERRC